MCVRLCTLLIARASPVTVLHCGPMPPCVSTLGQTAQCSTFQIATNPAKVQCKLGPPCNVQQSTPPTTSCTKEREHQQVVMAIGCNEPDVWTNVVPSKRVVQHQEGRATAMGSTSWVATMPCCLSVFPLGCLARCMDVGVYGILCVSFLCLLCAECQLALAGRASCGHRV